MTGPSPPPAAAARWVLIRGLCREQAHWGDFAAQLSAALGGAEVVAMDLPGNGSLHRQRSPRGVAAMVAGLRIALHCAPRACAVAPPLALLGLSMGGMVAAEWARLYPQEVQRCVLVNTSMAPWCPPWWRLRPAAWPRLACLAWHWREAVAQQHILRLTSAWPGRHHHLLPQWQALARARPVSAANALRQLLAAGRYSLRQPALGVPLLLVAGQCDRLVDPRCTQLLAHAWPGAEQRTHPQAGHDLPLDAGPWLAQQIARWCSNTV